MLFATKRAHLKRTKRCTLSVVTDVTVWQISSHIRHCCLSFRNICIITIIYVRLLRLFCFLGTKRHRRLWFNHSEVLRPIQAAALSNVWVCDRSIAGVAGSNPAGRRGFLCLVSVVCFQVEVSALGWSLAQRSSTECCLCNWVWSWSNENKEALAH